MDNIKPDGMSTKIKLKIQSCFALYFTFWEGASVKSYKIQLPVILIPILHQFLYQQISFFYNFLELHSTLSETPHPLNSKNLLSVTIFFLSIFPKIPSEFFLNICSQNPAKASFMCQQWTATADISLKVPATDSLVVFSEYISRAAILTKTSIITINIFF